MCGIVGLLVKKPQLREYLGELMVPMLIGMSDHRSDSAGLAVFTEPLADTHRKYSLYSGSTFNWQELAQAYQTHFEVEANITAPMGDRAVLTSHLSPDTVKLWLKQNYPQLHILSTGRTIDLYKDIGTPANVAHRYNFQ